MNSINEQQPEDNHEDLSGEKAIQKIKTLTEKAGTCFFCTHIKDGVPFETRPMAVQTVDDEGIFWFLSASDSGVNRDLAADPFAQLLFQGSAYTDFLNIYGIATVSQDKQKIKELWNPALKTWFTEGENDPRISVIEIEPTGGYYWDSKHNLMVGLVKRAVGAVIGKTLDDSIEGKLQV